LFAIGKDELIARVIPLVAGLFVAPVDAADIGTTDEAAAVAMGAGTGEALATEAAGAAPVLGRKVPTSQRSLCGVKATFSPFIPVTRRPLTAVLPEPRKLLSGWTARVKGPPEFWT
jgi:hypothetical protein